MASYQTAKHSDAHPTVQEGVLKSNQVEVTGGLTLAQLYGNAVQVFARNRSSSLFKGSKS